MYLLGNDGPHAEGNIASFDEAMELVHTVWQKVHSDCLFSEEQPLGGTPEELSIPHVIYHMDRRAHSDRFSDGKKPRVLRVYPDPDQEGQNITEVSEHFDVICDFHIYGNDKKETRKWAENFENFILTYTGYFKQKGISEILFCEELPRRVSSEYRQDLPHRHLRYLVRIQRNQILRSIRLDEIEIVAQVPPQSDDTSSGSIVYSTTVENEFLTLYNERIK